MLRQARESINIITMLMSQMDIAIMQKNTTSKFSVCYDHSSIEKHKEKVSINQLIKRHICLKLSSSLTLKKIPSGVAILWTSQFSLIRSHSMTRLAFCLFGEKYDFYKRLGVITYLFLFFFKGKQNKKENPKCDFSFGKDSL